jgi:pilus assembly protein CpaB
MAQAKQEPIKQSRVLLIAVIVGVIAVVLVQIYISKIKAESKPGEMIAFLAAREKIPALSRLEGKVIGQLLVPEKFAPSNAIPLRDLQEVVGQVVNRDIEAGELIRLSDFQLTSSMAEVTETIPEGFRAVTLPVNQVTSNAGLIRPGDHVDVLGTFIRPRGSSEGAGQRATVTIMQNILVLAVGQQIGAAVGTGGSGLETRTGLQYTTLTLLADLRRAEIMTFAMDRGQLTFLLRNPNDLETVQVAGADFGDIFEIDKRRAMQEEWNTKIEVLKGKGK